MTITQSGCDCELSWCASLNRMRRSDRDVGVISATIAIPAVCASDPPTPFLVPPPKRFPREARVRNLDAS